MASAGAVEAAVAVRIGLLGLGDGAGAIGVPTQVQLVGGRGRERGRSSGQVVSWAATVGRSDDVVSNARSRYDAGVQGGGSDLEVTLEGEGDRVAQDRQIIDQA